MVSKPEISGMGGAAAAAAHRSDDPERRRLRWLVFWFYVGVPVTLGFLLGWLQVGRSADWPRSVSLLYWLGVGLFMTPLNALGTAVIAPLMRRVHSPLWLTLFFGQLLAGFVLTKPLLQGYRQWLQANIYPDMTLTSSTTVADFLQRLPSNSLLWIGLNLLFFYGLRMPRFGYRPTTTTTTTTNGDQPELIAAPPLPPRAYQPALMERVRPERRGTLLALEAEGHYLRVHTDAGSDLILYRLSDAMLELADVDGAQVHRSWWVAADALSTARHRDYLQLVNSLEVPVSRSFRVTAQQRGWLT